MTLRRHYVDTPFGQAHLRLAGPAVDTGLLPLFCLPPQPLSGRALEPLLAALGRRRRVAAVDLPGFGLSDAPRGTAVEDDPASRLRRLIEQRQTESIEILRSWMETEEEHA